MTNTGKGARHRRTRRDWWTGLLWPGAVATVTVEQVLRQWQRECTYLRAAKPPAGGAPARRVVVLPRQHTAPRAAVTRPGMVGYQGSARVARLTIPANTVGPYGSCG